MYQCINGWTKEKMLKLFREHFKGKSYDADSGTCVYRDKHGNACAVGMFIPDDVYYRDTTENLASDALLESYKGLAAYMPLEKHACREMQRVHDRSTPRSTKESLLNWIKENVQ